MEFEKKLKRLEEIVSKMEEGKLSLEEHIKIFQEGMDLSRKCQKQLSEAEQKVKILMDVDKNSEVKTQDFDESHKNK